MYVRVKREKLCVFLLTEASDSILEIKSKLQRHLDKDPLDMKLVNVGNGQDFDDAKTLKDLHIQNDDVLGLCLRKEATAEDDAVWEELKITEPPASGQ
eukprot:jgi/Ulvmu1/4215/UM019_0194.1